MVIRRSSRDGATVPRLSTLPSPPSGGLSRTTPKQCSAVFHRHTRRRRHGGKASLARSRTRARRRDRSGLPSNFCLSLLSECRRPRLTAHPRRRTLGIRASSTLLLVRNPGPVVDARASQCRRAQATVLFRACTTVLFRRKCNPHYQARELSDNPRLKAFCRVAPSVRLKARAMLAARVFLLAAAFNLRTSSVVQARRFDLLAI